MAKDTTYKSESWIFGSKGVMARPANDRPPDAHFYLNENSVFEREESALSSRYGSTLITRDASGIGTNNYFFASPPVVLARMLSLYGANFRYAALANGTLWRRSGTTQGAYTQIASGLSGNRFSTLVLTCFGSAQPFTFLFDSQLQLKDSGTGSPTTIGISPPVVPMLSTQYAPGLLFIDYFQSGSGYGPSGTLSTAATVAGTSGIPILNGNYEQYTDATLSYANAPDGMVALSTHYVDGDPRLKFNTNRSNNTYDIVSPFTSTYNPTDSFVFKEVTFAFASNSTGTIGKTLAMDLGLYNPADIIVLVMQVSNPAAVQQITVQFDVNNSGYTSSYYSKTIIPVSYQGNLSIPQTNDPTTAMINEVFSLATGIVNTQQLGQPSTLPTNDPALPQIQSTQMTSGEGSWSVCLLQIGDFLPVGNAGEPGLDWSAITAWQVQVVTNTQGSTNVSFNSLYVQGSATASGIGTLAGPSSYGGVGYDARYTYWDATTLTESNGSWEGQWSVTQSNPGGESTLVVLRQAINMQGMYSSNPRVTHVRIYVRGGLYGDNWYYADQIPNAVPTTSATAPIITVQTFNSGGPASTVFITVQGAINPAILGTNVTISGLTTATFLNGLTFNVAIINGNTLEGIISLSHASYGPAPDTGIVTALSGNYFTLGLFNYKYIFPDSVLSQGNILNLQNDVPVTSTLQNPISTTLTVALNPVPAGTNTPTQVTVNVTQASAQFVPGQIVVIGNPSNEEQSFVVTGGMGGFTCYVFLPHAIGEPVQAFSQPAVACNLAASGYGQVWLAGDPNNPHLLYYTPKGYPENCPPQSYIPSPGGPSDPITAVINFRGTVFVRTYSTWYQVFPGSPPYMQSTGCKHGSPANFDWSITENEIWYQGFDGLRSFAGSGSTYRSLIIEWLFRNNPLTPITLVNLSQLSNVISVFKNNTVTFAYNGQDGNVHRLRWSTSYSRWRNDDLPCTAMLVEQDTNQLVYSVPITAGAQSGWAIAFEDINRDYDDGGWVSGALVQKPINLTLETPYLDFGAPNNQKQINALTLDINPNGQTITPLLLFDDNNGSVPPVTPSPAIITGTGRQKFNLQINEGLGQQAYRVSVQLTASVTAAPIIYQADIYQAVLADQTSSWDSYWKAFNSDQTKLIKQIYLDITSTGIVEVQVFSDGNTTPYFSFSIPANPTRFETPARYRLPALKMRLFRLVMTTVSGSMQVWNPVQVDTKDICIGKGYQRSELSQS
jgi:hypothetical protein